MLSSKNIKANKLNFDLEASGLLGVDVAEVFQYSWSSVPVGSPLADTANCGWKYGGEDFRQFRKQNVNLPSTGSCVHSIYIVLIAIDIAFGLSWWLSGKESVETWLQSLSWKDPLWKETATLSSILGWQIPWTEEPGGLQFLGSQRVGHHGNN